MMTAPPHKKDDGSGFLYIEPVDYTGYDNLDLYASYSLTKSDVIIYDDNQYNIQDGEITISGTGVTGSDKSYIVPNSTATITFQYTQKTEFVTAGDRVAFNYDSLIAQVKKQGESSVKASPSFRNNQLELDIGTYPQGVYLVTVYAYYKGKEYSYPISITKQDP